LPTGALALADLTGSISLDLQHARPVPNASSAWFCPGMLLLVDGIYIEDGTGEATLGSMGGIGATIAGKLVASNVAHPLAERRSQTLGIQIGADAHVGPAFGWTDFLGVGSERATGTRMRRLQSRTLGPGSSFAETTKIAIAADLALDQPSTLTAVRSLFAHYAARPAAETPLSIILMGNFASQPALAGAANGASLQYKESFNSLAGVLSDFPTVLSRTSLVFVPGDSDAWPSAFGAGGAVPIPRKPVPKIFTTRVGRVVAEANREAAREKRKAGRDGEVVWASNPARLTWFGCVGEMVLFRDDISGRLRRSAVRFKEQTEEGAESGAEPMEVDTTATNGEGEHVDPDVVAARQLIKTLLDQAHLAPFPISTRPVHWDYGCALSLFPLPSALVLADSEAPPFALNYMGCCVMNPGKLVEGRRGNKARWIEYDVLTNKGEIIMKGD
jgi:DNA polymerase epsilon subunit 2